jgi:hypothetical protein
MRRIGRSFVMAGRLLEGEGRDSWILSNSRLGRTGRSDDWCAPPLEAAGQSRTTLKTELTLPEESLLYFYVRIFMVVALVTAAFNAQPAILLPLLMLSFGLLAPLLLVPTLCIYLAALLPAAFARVAGLPRNAALILGLICLIEIAFAPSMAGHWFARKDAERVLAEDIAGHLEIAPRIIEFQQPAGSFVQRDDPLKSAACREACQTLLLSREVDRVRVIAVRRARDEPDAKAHGATPAVASVVYSYDERPACPRAFAEAKDAHPTTQSAASRGRCIVASVGGEVSAGARLVATEEKQGWVSRWSFLHTAGDLTRYELFVSDGNGWRLVSRTTELRTKVLTAPLAALPESDLGPAWGRMQVTINKTDPLSVLRQSGAYRAEQLKPQPDEPLQQTIERILSSAGTERLGPELMAPINKYVDTLARTSALQPADVSLLERLVANRRVTDLTRIFLALQRQPGATAGMVADLVERLETPGPESDHLHLAWMLVGAPAESLRPYAGRILALAASSEEWQVSPLLRIAGRLGADPTDLLTRRLKAKSNSVRASAAIGICTADEPWATTLAPAVETIIDFYRGRSFGGNEDLIVALKVMKRQGRDEAVDTFIRTLPEFDARRISASLGRPARTEREKCSG